MHVLMPSFSSSHPVQLMLLLPISPPPKQLLSCPSPLLGRPDQTQRPRRSRIYASLSSCVSYASQESMRKTSTVLICVIPLDVAWMPSTDLNIPCESGGRFKVRTSRTCIPSPWTATVTNGSALLPEGTDTNRGVAWRFLYVEDSG